MKILIFIVVLILFIKCAKEQKDLVDICYECTIKSYWYRNDTLINSNVNTTPMCNQTKEAREDYIRVNTHNSTTCKSEVECHLKN